MTFISEKYSYLRLHIKERKKYSYNHFMALWILSGATWVSGYQKGKTRKVKTNLDLLEKALLSGSGIVWAICKSAPCPDR